MKKLTATEAARRFSEVLDEVENKRETFVAQLTFALKDQIPNAMVLVNPLGLTITYFRVDQAFQ